MQRDVRCMYFCFPRTTRKPKYFLPGLCAFSPRFQRSLVHRQQRRASEKDVVVRARTSAPVKETRSKRARDSHDTILNVISANRDRVIPDPPLAPNL